MAIKLGITPHTYANIEKGRVDINTKKLVAVGKLLSIRPHQILALAEEVKEFGEQDWLPNMVKRLIKTCELAN